MILQKNFLVWQLKIPFWDNSIKKIGLMTAEMTLLEWQIKVPFWGDVW